MEGSPRGGEPSCKAPAMEVVDEAKP
jgi:hypothetical protein